MGHCHRSIRLAHHMTPSQYVCREGLDSLVELSQMSDVPLSTLERWYVSRPKVFRALLYQAVGEKHPHRKCPQGHRP